MQVFNGVTRFGLHHHHHVPEGLGMLSCSLILKMKLVPPSLPRSSYVSSCFGWYCSACFGSLFVSILCTCCSHFSWYCFISFTMFSAPAVFSSIPLTFHVAAFSFPNLCPSNLALLYWVSVRFFLLRILRVSWRPPDRLPARRSVSLVVGLPPWCL